MRSNEDGILALLAKGLRDLRNQVGHLARQPGPAGAAGRDGKNGLDGKDGKDGIGLRGLVGAAGRDGARGPAGRNGVDGKDGQPGPMGPMPKHEWRGTELRFQQTAGRWGKWVDLQGKPGRAGSAGGGVSVVGGTPWDPDALPVAGNGTPEEFIVKQNGIWRRATYAQMQTWLGGTPAPGPTTGLLTEGGDYLTTESGDFIVQE